MVYGDPSEPDFKVQNLAATPLQTARLQERVALLGQLDHDSPASIATRPMPRTDPRISP